MSKHKPLAGTDLGKAVCKHFGLNPNHVDVVSQIDFRPQAMASIKLTIMLTAEDLAGIARAAGADGVQTFTASGDFIKPSPVATISLDTKASETLRRYGTSTQANREAETLKLLYEIAKNTKRSACLAEDAAATSEANVQTVLRD